MNEFRDCVVIGGGPAGSTFAATVKKYAPAVNLTLLEQAHFPRYHIGESTIPVANAVLRDLELFDVLERSDAIKKIGIVFVWGQGREPWNADYLRLRDIQPEVGASHIIDVTGQDFERMFGAHRGRETPFTAFNVQRSVFDKLLLDRVRDAGADVREGVRVTAVLRDVNGAVSGVRWEDQAGRSGEIRTPFVLDASGLSALMTRGDREHDPHMNNFAVYGYLSNAGWKVTFNGRRERTTVFIASVDCGWIWYFPIGQDIMSVGVVTHRDYLRDRLHDLDLESFWWDTVKRCPEVADLVQGATLRNDVLPEGRRVAASRDWSSWARCPTGHGWAAAGDAAAFIDPILSSGLTLALQSGHRAAYTFNTVRSRPELPGHELWRAYADYIRGEAASFLTLARYFYGNNRTASSWWWESQRVINRSGRLLLNDRQSFTMATAGFFPTPRAISPDVVGSLLHHLSGTQANIMNIFSDSGVPPPEDLARCHFEILTPFRLGLRTEPDPTRAPRGQLDLYHDLVPEEVPFLHRLNAVPCRIPSTLAPIVEAMPRYHSVAALLGDACSMIAPGVASPSALDRAVLDLVRITLMKGFARLTSKSTGDVTIE